MKLTVWHEGPTLAGTYSVRWYDPDTGEKCRHRCFTFQEVQEFKTKKRRWLEARRTDKPDLATTPLVIFEEYLDSLRLTHRPSTIRIKRSALNPFLETLFSMNQLTGSRIDTWVKTMQAKYKPDTISINLRELRCFVLWCIKNRRLTENPMGGITIPVSSFVGRKISDEEKKKIFAATDGDFKLFLFMADETGARRSEMLRAELKHFDWERASWTIPKENSKTKKARTIPLTADLLEALKKQSQTAVDGLIFNGHGTTWAQKRWKKALKAAEIKDRVRIHDWRHTFASNWRGRPQALKDMSGWTTDHMIQHYTHLTLDDLREDLIKSKKIIGADLGHNIP